MKRREINIEPWALIAYIFLALVASYGIGWYIGHVTPPGAM